jgi:hypothetical protein
LLQLNAQLQELQPKWIVNNQLHSLIAISARRLAGAARAAGAAPPMIWNSVLPVNSAASSVEVAPLQQDKKHWQQPSPSVTDENCSSLLVHAQLQLHQQCAFIIDQACWHIGEQVACRLPGSHVNDSKTHRFEH